MSDSCATTPPLPPPSGDYANVIINCQCSLFNDSSSRSLNTPNCRDVTKIAIQVHRCVSKLLIRRGDLRNREALFLVITATISRRKKRATQSLGATGIPGCTIEGLQRRRTLVDARTHGRIGKNG
ncbi:hypothetical protein ALC57_05915 [Trachymyrmex cornetzi]|uniref:Uncharacterized protein n=1 Tax=Trachymyrmex cornetzi TaxID=471704 RepID=A0A151J9T2_9HYME|nr:hypothetical protein ALC57_05915 [Trachymyrmex cornetzi]